MATLLAAMMGSALLAGCVYEGPSTDGHLQVFLGGGGTTSGVTLTEVHLYARSEDGAPGDTQSVPASGPVESDPAPEVPTGRDSAGPDVFIGSDQEAESEAGHYTTTGSDDDRDPFLLENGDNGNNTGNATSDPTASDAQTNDTGILPGAYGTRTEMTVDEALDLSNLGQAQFVAATDVDAGTYAALTFVFEGTGNGAGGAGASQYLHVLVDLDVQEGQTTQVLVELASAAGVGNETAYEPHASRVLVATTEDDLGDDPGTSFREAEGASRAFVYALSEHEDPLLIEQDELRVPPAG